METRMGGVFAFSSAVFVFFLLLFHTTPVTAKTMQGGPIGFYLMNQEQIGLSPSQVSKLQEISMKFQKLKETETARIKMIQMEGMQLLMQKDININALKKDIDRVLQHKKNIMTARVEMLEEAHKVLTDEQFSKVKKIWRQMMMHNGLHHAMGQPPVAH